MMTTDCQAKYFAYDLTRRYAAGQEQYVSLPVWRLLSLPLPDAEIPVRCRAKARSGS
jgi:hypothetical protein